MNGFLRVSLLAALSGIALILALAGCGGGGEDSNTPGVLAPTAVVQPLPLSGHYVVACSNIEQNFDSLPVSEVERYWEGDGGLYVTDLLEDNTLIAKVPATLTQDSGLYGDFAGQEVEFVVIVCYPTTSDNSDSNYMLPTGKFVPHMQTVSETGSVNPPLFAPDLDKYPVIAFSHGYMGSPLGGDYIQALSVLQVTVTL